MTKEMDVCMVWVMIGVFLTISSLIFDSFNLISSTLLGGGLALMVMALMVITFA